VPSRPFATSIGLRPPPSMEASPSFLPAESRRASAPYFSSIFERSTVGLGYFFSPFVVFLSLTRSILLSSFLKLLPLPSLSLLQRPREARNEPKIPPACSFSGFSRPFLQLVGPLYQALFIAMISLPALREMPCPQVPTAVRLQFFSLVAV